MSQEIVGNVLDPKYRDAKEPPSASLAVADLFRLDQRTIVVTGAAGCLGSTVAEAILESGGDVVCLDILDAPSESKWANIQSIAKKHSQQVTYIQYDQRSEESVNAAFDRMKNLRYPMRGLVACVGVMDACSAVTFPSDSFTRLLDVNVVGTFRVVQRFVNNLQSNPASVVLVSSMSGHVSYKGLDTMAYNASKAALHQMTRSLAAEWGACVNVPLIRVNSLSPGCIRTPASAEVLQGTGLEEMLINDSMLYRLSTADEYRAPVIFLPGDGSSYMTGSGLRVDGGHCAW